VTDSTKQTTSIHHQIHCHQWEDMSVLVTVFLNCDEVTTLVNEISDKHSQTNSYHHI